MRRYITLGPRTMHWLFAREHDRVNELQLPWNHTARKLRNHASAILTTARTELLSYSHCQSTDRSCASRPERTQLAPSNQSKNRIRRGGRRGPGLRKTGIRRSALPRKADGGNRLRAVRDPCKKPRSQNTGRIRPSCIVRRFLTRTPNSPKAAQVDLDRLDQISVAQRRW